MSNSLAIAAVTATLQRLLTDQVPEGLPPDLPAEFNPGDLRVTVRPPDKARNDAISQINLFLYHTAFNAAWRNEPSPARVNPGEVGSPPLALDLYYLLTAYGRENNDISAHILLGQAMRVLHDHALLGAAELQAALPGSDVHNQIDRVRIRHQPLSLEEMTKLWSAFQTNYQLSVAYQVAVVLIESKRPVRAALPVLRRGSEDRGALVASGLILPYPALESARPATPDPSALPGGTVILAGQNLDGEDVQLRVTRPRETEPVVLAPAAGGTATEISFSVPADPDGWPAGFYRVAAAVRKAGETDARLTNEVGFALAPSIEEITVEEGETRALRVRANPKVRAAQQVALIVGDRELAPEPFSGAAEVVRFPIGDLAAGTYFVRLRVDGVDSLLVDRSVQPPVFKESQRVTIP